MNLKPVIKLLKHIKIIIHPLGDLFFLYIIVIHLLCI